MPIVDASRLPRIDALGDLRGFRRAKFRYDYKSDCHGCCIEALVADHEAGRLTPSTPTKCACGRSWILTGGKWHVGEVAQKTVRPPKPLRTLEAMARQKQLRRQK